jgi:hypothetical protein
MIRAFGMGMDRISIESTSPACILFPPTRAGPPKSPEANSGRGDCSLPDAHVPGNVASDSEYFEGAREAAPEHWEILLQGTVHDQQPQPFSKFVACFRQQTGFPKSERRMQSD